MHYGYSRESAQRIFIIARSELQKEMDDMALKNSVETASEEAALTKEELRRVLELSETDK